MSARVMKQIWWYCLAASVVVVLSGCGDDAAPGSVSNGADNNASTNNGGDNNGTNNAPTNNGSNNGPTNNANNNGTDNNGTDNNGTDNNGTDNNGTPCVPSTEVCDGEDNDCDGLTDAADDSLELRLCASLTHAEALGCNGGQCVYVCVGEAVDVDGDLATGSAGTGCECTPTVPAMEVCDGLDNDCDGDQDADDADLELSACASLEGASVVACAAGACVYRCDTDRVDIDVDLELGTDGTGCECDLSNMGVERCDGVDNDCNGQTDEGCDDDNDDWCDAAMDTDGTPTVCPLGGGDCDDDVELVRPGATEVCDGLDNDCNGQTDEGCDDDGDDWCDAAMTTVGTPAVCPHGGGDCADAAGDGAVNPGATEQCDDVDNNCASGTDEGCDDDNDDWCDAALTTVGTPTVCPHGGGDCQDSGPDAALRYPGNVEICDNIDNDCDNLVDSADTTNGAYMEVACTEMLGVCAGSLEVCDTGNLLSCTEEQYTSWATSHSARFEGLGVLELLCDSADNNCDGDTDENCCGMSEGRFTVASATGTVREVVPSVASNPDGTRFAVAWQQTSTAPANAVPADGTVWFAIYDRMGGVVSAPSRPSIPSPADIAPTVLWDHAAFALVWEQEGGGVGDDAFRVEWYGPNGGALLGFRNLGAGGPGETEPRATSYGSSRGVVLSWLSRVEVPPSSGMYQTEVRHAVATPSMGAVTGTAVAAGGDGLLLPPSVGFGNGWGLVVYGDLSTGHLRWAELDAAAAPQAGRGESLLTRFGVSTSAPRPSIAIPGSTAYIAYEDYVGTTVQVRVISVSGSNVGPSAAVHVTSGGSSKTHPSLVSLGTEGGVEQLGLTYAEGNEVYFVKLGGDGMAQAPVALLARDQRGLLSYRPSAAAPVPGIGAVVGTAEQSFGSVADRVEFSVLNAEGARLCLP